MDQEEGQSSAEDSELSAEDECSDAAGGGQDTRRLCTCRACTVFNPAGRRVSARTWLLHAAADRDRARPPAVEGEPAAKRPRIPSVGAGEPPRDAAVVAPAAVGNYNIRYVICSTYMSDCHTSTSNRHLPSPKTYRRDWCPDIWYARSRKMGLTRRTGRCGHRPRRLASPRRCGRSWRRGEGRRARSRRRLGRGRR